MQDDTPTRDRLLPPMAAHVLRHGLTGASLRPLAKAAGTSDRMLIYHFGTKEGLIAALLTHLAGDFAARLSELTTGPFPDAESAVRDLVAAQLRAEMTDYVRLWMEIVAEAARGSAAHRQAGGAILTGLAAWLAERLHPADRHATWQIILQIEGAMVLWSLGVDPDAPVPHP